MGSADKNYVLGDDLKLGHIMMVHRDGTLDGKPDNRPPKFNVWVTFGPRVLSHLRVTARMFGVADWVAATKRAHPAVGEWLSELRDDELPCMHQLARQYLQGE